MNRTSFFFFLGGIFGILVVRAFFLGPLEEIGWRIFWEGVLHGNLMDIGVVLKSSSFAKAVVGFILGGLIAALISGKKQLMFDGAMFLKKYSRMVIYLGLAIIALVSIPQLIKYGKQVFTDKPNESKEKLIYDSTLSLKEITSSLETMTNVQKETYLNGLKGRQILWTGAVTDVKETSPSKYEVSVNISSLSLMGTPFSALTLLAGESANFIVSEQIALSLKKDQLILFVGKINSISHEFNLMVKLSSAKVLLQFNENDKWWVYNWQLQKCDYGVLDGRNISPHLLIKNDCTVKTYNEQAGLLFMQCGEDKGAIFANSEDECNKINSSVKKPATANDDQSYKLSIRFSMEKNTDNNFIKDGNRLFDNRDFEKAIEAFTKAIDQNPKEEYAYKNRGVTYAGLDMYQEAISDFTKALEVNDKSATTYFYRAFMHYMTKDSQGVFDDCSRAIELKADYAEAFLLRAVSGKSQNAREDLERASQLGSKEAKVLIEAYSKLKSGAASVKK